MTEDEWVRAHESEIWKAVAALGLRRNRLLGVALVRTYGGATGDTIRKAMTVAERFADTGRYKESLRKARESIKQAQTDIHNSVPDGTHNAWCTPENEHALRELSIAEGAVCSVHSLSLVIDRAVRAHCEADRLSIPEARRVVYPIFREIAGPPAVAFAPEWRTGTAVALAKGMYESRDFGAMPILADALQDAGCTSDDILNHCRDAHATHVRGCWVVDLVLGKS